METWQLALNLVGLALLLTGIFIGVPRFNTEEAVTKPSIDIDDTGAAKVEMKDLKEQASPASLEPAVTS